MALSKLFSSFFPGVKGMVADFLSYKIGGTAVTASAAELNILDGVLATAAEINRACDASTRVVALTGNTTLTELEHDGKIIVVNKADGAALTLPAAAGTGTVLRILIGTAITSSATTIKVVGNDVMFGYAIVANDDSATAITEYKTAADTDTITMDGSTKGGLVGDYIELVDFAADKWFVSMRIKATGSEATPFSATVS